MLRAVYGIRQMSPASASVRIIWYTVGGVTPKCRWKSASAVARASGGAGWPAGARRRTLRRRRPSLARYVGYRTG